MNRMWNTMMKMMRLDDPTLWDMFWLLEIITAVFAVGATTILGFIVSIIVGIEPYGVELFLGWLVIFLVTEYVMMRLMALIVEVVEDEQERRYLEG